MMILAGMTFVLGVTCAFFLRLPALIGVAIAAAMLSAAAAIFDVDLDTSPVGGFIIGGLAVQIGYVAGIAARTVISPFFEGHAHERGHVSKGATNPSAG